MAELFDKVRFNAGDAKRSYTWYQNQVKSLGRSITPNRLFNEADSLVNTIMPGDMYLFYYSPKHKETLPYYDSFPLVLPFRKVDDGFYGINLHYLPYLLRFNLLRALDDAADKKNERERIYISWSILNSTSKLEAATVCVKHYLTTQIRSKFLKISRDNWITASQLPVEQFNKATNKQVWADSIRRLSK